jgi:hypothetical protein
MLYRRPQMLLRLRAKGRYSAKSRAVAAHLRRRDRVIEAFRWKLVLPLRIALLDHQQPSEGGLAFDSRAHCSDTGCRPPQSRGKRRTASHQDLRDPGSSGASPEKFFGQSKILVDARLVLRTGHSMVTHNNLQGGEYAQTLRLMVGRVGIEPTTKSLRGQSARARECARIRLS